MIIKLHNNCLTFVFFLFLFSACEKKENNPDNYLDEPNCTSSFMPKTYNFQVVGFYPTWEHVKMPVSAIPWDKLTRLIYAFAIPNTDGTLNTSSLVYTSQLVDSAHAHGVEVYFSIGGGGTGSNSFPVMATNKNSFLKSMLQK